MKKAMFVSLLFFVTSHLLAESLTSASASDIKVSFEKDRWEVLKYSKIKSNDVTFKNNHMNIAVDGSASPLIYPLKQAQTFNTLMVKARISGNLKLGKKQGEKGADDFRLRIGLVYEGKETLGFFKRQIAASWVIKLFNLAPKGSGVSRIEFFNTYTDKSLEGQKRDHPLAEILKESFVLKVDGKGNIHQSINIPTDQKVAAIWISCDGDDTKSKYQVLLQELSLSLR